MITDNTDTDNRGGATKQVQPFTYRWATLYSGEPQVKDTPGIVYAAGGDFEVTRCTVTRTYNGKRGLR